MPPAYAIVEHRLPNRLRLRVPSRRDAAPFFATLVACLAEHPQVEEVHADPRTAGVLVLHSGEEAAILGSACERGLIELREPQTAPPPAVGSARAAAAAPGSGEIPSFDTVLAGVLGLLGCVQLLRGRTLGPASELLWNTYALAGLLRGGPLMPVAVVAILVKLLQGPVLGSASSLFFYALACRDMARGGRTEGRLPDPFSPGGRDTGTGS